jgi:hypothetical protein
MQASLSRLVVATQQVGENMTYLLTITTMHASLSRLVVATQQVGENMTHRLTTRMEKQGFDL